MDKKQIVIIGAGPAGLTAAYHLLKNSKDYEVVILEQENMVGGISKTVSFNGYMVDTGIHRFFTKNDDVQKTWEEILPMQSKPAYDDIELKREKEFPKEGSDPETEEKSLLIKDRITRIYYGRKFYDYPVSLNMVTIKNMGILTMMKAGFSYLKTCIIKKPETSLENFYINRFGKVLYSMFFESYTEKVWGIRPSKISPDWGSQRVKGVSISEIIKDIARKIFGKKNSKNTQTSLIEQFIYPKLGAGQMWEEMANKVKDLGGKIYLNSRLKNLIVEDGQIVQVEYEENGELKKLDSSFCISSMPIKNLFEGIKGMEIPQDIYDSATKLPYREFMSVCMVVDKLKLKNETNVKTLGDIVPDSWIYVQEPDVRMGRLQVFNNWSPYIFKNKEDMGKKALIGIEYFCSEEDEHWNMSDEDFIKFAEKEAIKIGLIDEGGVKEATRIKIPKAYPAYFGTYAQIDKIEKYLNTYKNLYCIGRNGQHKYNNMDHSMLTGIETARNIIEGKTDKEHIWKVNTEKEYHEVKK